ncbi:MAG: DUF2937 family protein [Methylobacteriaceae bacterium]|nr:DUF2937 family protein [Methylobacteriaceae bacterium]
MIPRISFIVGVLAALVGSQLPEFAQQYRQALNGAIGALGEVVERFDATAQASNLTPDEAIKRLKENSERIAQNTGLDMIETKARLLRLERQRDAFVEAGPFTRILVLARDFDPAIASGAFENFEPAVPTSGEGIVTAIVGFLAGGGLLQLLALPFRRRQPVAVPAIVRPARRTRPEANPARAQSIHLRQRINRFTLPPGGSPPREGKR